MNLDQLEKKAETCQRCPLHEGRTKSVFSSGSPKAGIMVIGEAPGAKEDEKGIPFVGRAGKLLTKALARIGKDRARDVYITNAVKCRPPDNRNPDFDELLECRAYLSEQVMRVAPLLIVCTGRVATQTLFISAKDITISKMRGSVYYKGNIPVVVMYHPAYILRNRSESYKWAEDWRFVDATYRKICLKRADDVHTEA